MPLVEAWGLNLSLSSICSYLCHGDLTFFFISFALGEIRERNTKHDCRRGSPVIYSLCVDKAIVRTSAQEHGLIITGQSGNR
jgi:hypothetical protein